MLRTLPLRLSRRPITHRRCYATAAKTVDLDYSLHVPHDGNTTENPLVILHGLFGSRKNWSSLSKAFVKDLKRPIYGIDLRNHGTSPHATPMDYATMAADIIHFFQQHSLSNVSLLGHSLGGKVAMTTALNPTLPPGILSNLIVADIAPSRGKMSAEFISYVHAMKEIEAANITSRKEATKILNKYEKDPSICAFLLTNFVVPSPTESGEYFPGKFRVPVDIIGDAIDSLGDFPYSPGEVEWDGPTLFIKGDRSKYMNAHNIATANEFFPRMKIEHLNAGHWVHAEMPDQFKHIVIDFIK